MGTTVVGIRKVHGWSKQIARTIFALGIESCIDVSTCLIAKEAVPARCLGEVGEVRNRSSVGFILGAKSHLAESFVDEWNLLGSCFVGSDSLDSSVLVAECVDELLSGEALACIALEEVLDLNGKLSLSHYLFLTL